MSAVQEKQDVYFRNFASLEKRLGASDPSWLRAIRKGALERFAELGFPTTRLEDWKYTSVAPIARIPFAPAPPDTGSKRSLPASLGYKDFAASLVFVNGRCVEQLPASDALPSGVRVTSLAAALAGPHAALVEQHLTRYARYDDHAFVALNTAFIEDGAFI